MNNYIDVKLQPDSEMPLNWLMNAVYTKLHKVLWDIQSTEVGVSFPSYKVTLGNALRLHGNQAKLAQLVDGSWLGGMRGYCTISQIQSVPENSDYRVITRKQATMSDSKLKRLLKRGSITEAEIKAYRTKMFTKGLDEPYVELVSASNGKKHRRYIELGELLDEPVEGVFDSFGLSKTATVPWF